MSRPAAFLGSKTGHGGDVVQGSSDVLVNGKGAVRVGHAVVCPKHGKSAVATGRKDVFVNGELMSRLDDKVVCVGPPSGGSGALVDHGKPTTNVGGDDVYVDGSLTDLPEKELDELLKALESRDPVAIHDAWKKLPNKGNSGKVVIKVVDPANPNAWTETEITGPGVDNAPLIPGQTPLRVNPDSNQGQVGGGSQVVGMKKTWVKRYVAEDGSVVERRASWSVSASDGAKLEGESSDRRRGFSFDTPWIFGGGYEEITISPANPVGSPPGRVLPAVDVIVEPVSPDVLLGD